MDWSRNRDKFTVGVYFSSAHLNKNIICNILTKTRRRSWGGRELVRVTPRGVSCKATFRQLRYWRRGGIASVCIKIDKATLKYRHDILWRTTNEDKLIRPLRLYVNMFCSLPRPRRYHSIIAVVNDGIINHSIPMTNILQFSYKLYWLRFDVYFSMFISVQYAIVTLIICVNCHCKFTAYYFLYIYNFNHLHLYYTYNSLFFLVNIFIIQIRQTEW